MSADIAATGRVDLAAPEILIAVRRELDRGAQIMFVNLEGTLTTATAGKCASMHARPGACLAFRDPPGYVRYLKHAGFTVFSDANPHSFDFGAAGQAQTTAGARHEPDYIGTLKPDL